MKIQYLTFSIYLLWFGCSGAGYADVKISNAMRGHGSPYLQLHANDPVAWQNWDAQVIARAKAGNKLIFVSIGYFSCHWCHVMQRESFSDQQIANLMNAQFIPVKVDRELHPALDAYLIEFVQRTRGTAGWPLNIIITPQGYPVVGVTYLPKDRLSKLLKQMAQLWQDNEVFIKQMAQQAANQLRDEKQLSKTRLQKGIEARYAGKFLQQAMDIADEMSGGFGEQSKFPMVPQLTALLSQYERDPQPVLKTFLVLTLDQMATQGLRDHIGGGFFRYTVDPTWQTPHFEKMLYDNAALSVLYARAARVFKREDYKGVARETLNFMARELLTKDGALISSLSAVDHANVEGGYYLWEQTQLKNLLTSQQYDVVYWLWNMDNKSSFDAGYLPRQVRSPDFVADKLGISIKEVMETLGSAQFTLFQARQKRSVPKDTKQLAAWNGLALQAFIEGTAFDQDDKYKSIAAGIRDYLAKVLWNGEVLVRATTGKDQLGEDALEDYAYAAYGLWQWYLKTGNSQDLKLARRWVEIAWQRFYDKTGWMLSDSALLPLNFGNPVTKDAPLPSPSAQLVKLSMELVEHQNDEALRNKVVEALSIGHENLESNPFYYVSQIENLINYLSDK